MNENVNVNDKIINDLKIDLNASTSNLATLEQEHLHLQQLWVSQQPHSNLLQQTGAQHYNMQQHSQSAFTTGKYSKRRCSAKCSLVIIVRIVFISLFLFYCLLLNHSFQINTQAVLLTAFNFFSSIATLQNYICSMRSSIFDF